MIVHGEGSRYVVSEMRGRTVGDESAHTTTDYAVLDSDYCYGVVARYSVRSDRSIGSTRRRNRAVRACDRLNAAEAGSFMGSLHHWNGTLGCDKCGRRVGLGSAVIRDETVLCPRCAA